MTTRDRVYRVVKLIPRGKVLGYGDVGQLLTPSLSGLLVGRALATAPPDVPWWRVVGRTGELLVAKRDPQLAIEQRLRLENEGVTMKEDRVDMEAHRIDPFTLED